jgi:hypothetical protein
MIATPTDSFHRDRPSARRQSRSSLTLVSSPKVNGDGRTGVADFQGHVHSLWLSSKAAVRLDLTLDFFDHHLQGMDQTLDGMLPGLQSGLQAECTDGLGGFRTD